MQRELRVVRRMPGASGSHAGKEMKGGRDMGDSTGSMFYAFGAFLLIYIIGATIYQIYLWIKKRKDRRKFEED